MRALTDAEREAYDHIPPELAARIRILKVPVLAFKAAGMTLDRFVLLRRDDPADRTGDSELLAHELVHAVQWAELGVVPFAARYLREYLSNLRRARRHHQAYLDISFEEAARVAAAHWVSLRSGPGATRR